MKKAVLAMAAALMFAAVSDAAVRELRYFTIDVPAGWSVHEMEGGAAVFLSPDKDASFSLLYEPAGGRDAATAAKEHAARLNGSAPTDDGEGMHTFTIKSGDGTETFCLCSIDGEMFKLLTLTDPSRKYGDTIGTALTSIVEK